eukprot:470532_1
MSSTETVYFEILLALAFCIAVSNLLHTYKIGVIHESGSSIIVGVLVSGLILLSGTKFDGGTFNPDFFFYALLPPIIFTAGYLLKKKKFFANIMLISFLGVFATFMHFIILAVCVQQMSSSGWIRTLLDEHVILTHREVMLFAAILSATDSVAVLSILDSTTHPVIYGVLTGEAIVNDAVAISLTRSIEYQLEVDEHMHEVESLSFAVLGTIFVQFLKVFCGSMIVGCVGGLTSARFFKTLRYKAHVKREVAIVFLLALCAYFLSEILEFSGIIALFFCAVVMSHYTLYSLSEEGQISTKDMSETVGFLSETFVFLSLGFYIFHYTNYLSWSASFFFATLGVMLAQRILTVFLLCSIANCFQVPEYRAGWRRQLALFYGGTVRGAVSFALVVTTKSKNHDLLVTTILLNVIFTTLVFGGTTELFMKMLKIRQPPTEPNSPIASPLVAPRAAEQKACGRPRTRENRSRFMQTLRYWDARYMKRWFGGDIEKARRIIAQHRAYVSINEDHRPPDTADRMSQYAESTDPLLRNSSHSSPKLSDQLGGSQRYSSIEMDKDEKEIPELPIKNENENK